MNQSHGQLNADILGKFDEAFTGLNGTLVDAIETSFRDANNRGVKTLLANQKVQSLQEYFVIFQRTHNKKQLLKYMKPIPQAIYDIVVDTEDHHWYLRQPGHNMKQVNYKTVVEASETVLKAFKGIFEVFNSDTSSSTSVDVSRLTNEQSILYNAATDISQSIQAELQGRMHQ